MRKFIRSGGVLLLLSFLFSAKTFAQSGIDLTHCYGPCTAGDFTIVEAFLSDANGVRIPANACQGGGTVTAHISFTFQNTTNSSRNGIFISGTITGASVSPSQNGYIFQCFPGVVAKKQTV